MLLGNPVFYPAKTSASIHERLGVDFGW